MKALHRSAALNRIGVAASGCDSDLAANCLNFGAGDFFFKFLAQTRSFVVCRRDSVLELQFLLPLHVDPGSLQLSLCKSHWIGCAKIDDYFAAMSLHLALTFLLLQNSFEKVFQTGFCFAAVPRSNLKF